MTYEMWWSPVNRNVSPEPRNLRSLGNHGLGGVSCQGDRKPVMAMAKSPSRAGLLLSSIAWPPGVAERLREQDVLFVWEEEVGSLLASRTRVRSMDRGRLTVTVSGSAWMQELQYLKDEIRQKLNCRLGAPLVQEIHLVSGSGRRRKPAEDGSVPPPLPVDEAEIAALVPKIGKPEIEAGLRAIARARARRLGR